MKWLKRVILNYLLEAADEATDRAIAKLQKRLQQQQAREEQSK